MNSDKKINIIIADDHALFADGIEQVLMKENELFIYGKANNGKQLVQMLNNFVPDLILMDIHMPYLDGVNGKKQKPKN